MAYKYRDLSIRDVPADENGKRWCVAGGFTDATGSGGGVLEWCVDEHDALTMLIRMKQFPEFSRLTVDKW